jgi:hypothetical protein
LKARASENINNYLFLDFYVNFQNRININKYSSRNFTDFDQTHDTVNLESYFIKVTGPGLLDGLED